MTSIEQRRAIAVEQQQRVVRTSAPAYVQACPGAGKTRVIVERHLTRPIYGARRGRALVSFTNVACAEIQQRCTEKARGDLLRFPHFVGTVDTFLWRYLVRPFIEPDRRRHRIDSWDRINAVVTVPARPHDHKIRLSDFQFRHDLNTGRCIAQIQQSNRVYPVLNRLKAEGLVQQAEAEAVRLRTEYARDDGYVTGHEIRVLARYYLRTRYVDVVSLLRTRFDEIIIDEAQDCSNLDLAILAEVRDAAIPLLFIGDPDQAIYEFRGAEPDCVRAFGATLAEQIKLTGNWRSTSAICQTAATLRPKWLARPADDPVGDHHCDGNGILLLRASNAVEVDAAVTTFIAQSRNLEIPADQQLILAHAGRRLPKGSAGSTQPPASPIAARVAWAAAVLSDSHPQRVRDTAYDILERALITYWYSGTDGATIDVLCDRNGLDRAAFRRLAARAGCALPGVSQGTFAEWCKEANAVFKQFPPNPGQRRASQGGRLVAGAAKDKSPRNVAAVSAGGGGEIRASVIHQVKGEEADAVLVVVPDEDRTTATVDAWTSGEHPPEIAENLRVLYVAVSRARRLLALALPNSVFETVQDHLKAEGIPTRTAAT
ncbi:UvrD-helicase domain-containing protein [Saccharomonospora piscinae]|uniref:UvrD-helicase domain-containing protein n=1 Tax=Saccharomonospora piscinae TaxID=687388 RepID=UPI001421DDE2|nr:UvrD-helicase domain-containing protein [Saccharomonospora piscinae]